MSTGVETSVGAAVLCAAETVAVEGDRGGGEEEHAGEEAGEAGGGEEECAGPEAAAAVTDETASLLRVLHSLAHSASDTRRRTCSGVAQPRPTNMRLQAHKAHSTTAEWNTGEG